MKHRINQFFQSAFIQVILVLIISYASALALPNSAIENYRSTIVRSDDGKVQRYSVLVATVGDPKTNSDFSEYFVQRVDPKYYAKGQIYVKTKAKTDNGKDNILQGASKLNSALQAIGSTEITAFADAKRVEKNPGLRKYGLDRLYKISIPLDKDPFDVCAELMNNPDVEYACPVSVAYPLSDKPNDPYIIRQHYLHTMKVLEAWKYSKGSPDIKIAIIDSGVDYEHPDLAAHIWTNPNEIPNDGIDNDGNGKIDDYRGWDFFANEDEASILNGKFKEDNDPINKKKHHGTEVSGIVGAVTNNNIGIAGVAYNCKIIPVKIGSEIPGVDYIQRGYEAIVYAAELGADIINCSWGVIGDLPANDDMINYVVFDKKSVIVAGAGNDSKSNDIVPFYPASHNNVISAGAVNIGDNIAFFSNYGYNVDIFALGSNIYSTKNNGRYGINQGTSFASPNVAGVVALVKAVHSDWSPKKIYYQIRSTCKLMEDWKKTNYYYRVIDAFKAVTYNSEHSDTTVPCIITEKIFFNDDKSQNVIKDFDENVINIEIKNYLSTTRNLKVKIRCLDKYLSLIDTVATVEEIETDGTAIISIRAKFLENHPWSECTSSLLLLFEGENGIYNDYELIKIKLALPSDIEFKTLNVMSDINKLVSEATDIHAGWCASWSKGKMSHLFSCNFASDRRYFNRIRENYIPRAIATIDSNIAYVATENISKKSVDIFMTYDACKTIRRGNLRDILDRVRVLYFKDKNNGLAIGSDKDEKVCVAITNNAALDWTIIQSIPEASFSGGNVVENLHTRINDCIYFAAANGAVFKSEDFGKTWTQKANLPESTYSIAFLDVNTGMAVLKGNEIAITKDGGNSWSIVKDVLPPRGEVKPENILADRFSRSFILVYDDGSIYKTDDLGATWKAIRKPQRNSKVVSSSLYSNENGEVAIYLFGEIAEQVFYKVKKSSVEVLTSKYKLIPNPATNSCQLFFGDDADKVETLQIFSSDGRLIMTLSPSISNNIAQINTSSFPSGQYIVLIKGDGINETLKLIIAK